MKSIIYYFSGTGNSLAIAKDLALELGSTEVLSLSKQSGQTQLSQDVDFVGLVYPVYALGPPLMVVDFLSRLKLSENTYLFAIANYASVQGAGISKIRRIAKRYGLNLRSAFGVVMPGNYTPFYGAWPEARQKKAFEKEKAQVKRIALILKEPKTGIFDLGFFLVRWLLWEPIAFFSAAMTPGEDKNFWVTNKCNGCRVCKQVCPVSNIEIEEQKPKWQHRCQQCFACFHWCPKEAIQCGKKTIKRARYRHPEAKLEDFIQENSVC